MIEELGIRESVPSDAALIEKLYPDAFPDEDLLPLVRELLREETETLSLVAIVDQALVGHVLFTACSIAGSPGKVSLLGPLAVASDWQRQGIGGALIRKGLQILKNAGAVQVFVLGDPNYYKRAGFKPDANVMPPYALPSEWAEAWQSVSLDEGQPPHGTLAVPQPWRQPALWLP